MAKEYVPIFFDWFDVTDKLTAQQKGFLIDAVVAHYKYGEKEQYIINKNSPDSLKEAFIKTVERADLYFASKYNGRSGEFHWNWKGGITPVNQRERSSSKYAEWRKAVFLRDNFTCQLCGKVGGGLQAHHVKRWSTNVNERYQVSNGVTLCEKCHKALHGKGG